MYGANANILIVEDEESLARMLRTTLIQAGYTVTVARTGGDALKVLEANKFGVILVDLGLPDMDGKQVIERAQATTHAPFLVISARHSETEKIAALDLGASDYVAKPFDVGELLARIRVALRPPRAASCECEKEPRLVIDGRARRAVVDGSPVRLSQKEAEFLQLLSDADGSVVSHDEIMQTIWGRTDPDAMNVRVLAWQVRRKIEPDPVAPRFLIAESGEGYRLLVD